MIDRKEYIYKLQKRMNSLNYNISIIEAELQKTVGDAKFWLNNKLIDIKYNKLMLEDKFNLIKKNTKEIKDDTINSIEDIEKRITEIFKSIKKDVTT